MFQVTHLGWQGWFVADEQSAILVDPVLGESVGRSLPPVRQLFPCWPPRQVDLRALGPIDAVLLTHEHEDHFDLFTLNLLDRRIPVHLSHRSSPAARTILTEMGFSVRPLREGQPLSCGSLVIHPLGAEHRAADAYEDEWDVVPLLIQSAAGHGSFFTNVDAPLSDGLLQGADLIARARSAGATLACLSGELQLCPDGLLVRRPRTPSHEGVALEQSAVALKVLNEGDTIKPCAGNTVIMRAGRVAAWQVAAPFLRTAPASDWPPAPPFWPDGRAALQPAFGPPALTGPELSEVEAGLTRLAEWMYGGPLFRWLLSLSLPTPEQDGPAGFTWLLLTGESEGYAVEYAPQRCQFVPVELTASGGAGSVMCWARDLLVLLRGEVDPRTLTKHFRERWSFDPPLAMPFSRYVVWPYFHPMRHPDLCLRQYRRLRAHLADACPGGVGSIDARKSAPVAGGAG